MKVYELEENDVLLVRIDTSGLRGPGMPNDAQHSLKMTLEDFFTSIGMSIEVLVLGSHLKLEKLKITKKYD